MLLLMSSPCHAHRSYPSCWATAHGDKAFHISAGSSSRTKQQNYVPEIDSKHLRATKRELTNHPCSTSGSNSRSAAAAAVSNQTVKYLITMNGGVLAFEGSTSNNMQQPIVLVGMMCSSSSPKLRLTLATLRGTVVVGTSQQQLQTTMILAALWTEACLSVFPAAASDRWRWSWRLSADKAQSKFSRSSLSLKSSVDGPDGPQLCSAWTNRWIMI